jgi:xylulokinase
MTHRPELAMSTYLLGVDVGTHSTKGVLVTQDGQVVAQGAVEHDVSRPRPGWAEHDADAVWWNDVSQVIPRLLNEASAQPGQVASVGVSGLAPAMVPIDADGRPLRPGILYGIDARATAEIDWFNSELGWDLPGTPPARRMQAQSLAPKIVWFRDHEPERWKRTHQILGPTGYIVYRLTGARVIDSADAEALVPFYDPIIDNWDSSMCNRFGVPLEVLPRIQQPTDIVGTVTPQAARHTGLAIGTPVICGSMDGLTEYLSSGVIQSGEGCVVFGSTMCVCVLSSEQRTHPSLYGGRSLVPGMFRLSGGMATSGALTRWFRDEFSPRQDFESLSKDASVVSAGSDGLVVLPYFGGERSPIFDGQARGLVLGLTVSHTRAHLYRALLEGVAYALRHHFELMAQIGVIPRRLVALGGGARSELWRQIVSNVTGHTLECVERDVGAPLADAFLAGYGIGLFDDFSQLSESWVRIGEIVSPDPECSSVYDRYYSVYRRLYERTKEDMHELTCLSTSLPIGR